MSRKKSRVPGEDPKTKPRRAPSSPEALASRASSSAAIRETIESVVVAFVLAFLFRTFEAEAFVIPTGSMAPTLMGRHKDLEQCPVCGYAFQVSASDEVDQNGHRKQPGYSVVECVCPMCRFPMDVGPDNSLGEDYPSCKGDRILVSKFAYQFSNPKRWDVAVFKYPGGAKTNFIKRLVGLPGETIRIENGDIFHRPTAEPESRFTIARKSPQKLLAMLQPVFDNDTTPAILKYGWTPRWQAEGNAASSSTDDDYRSFQLDGSVSGDSWIRYRHLVPTTLQWHEALANDGQPPMPRVEPQLISDFNPYNTGLQSRDMGPEPGSSGLHWVGDLALSCTIEAKSNVGEAVFELIEGGRHMQCRIDLANGSAVLLVEGLDDFHPTAPTAIREPGKHEVTFSNVDDQLRLWVDGEVVTFDGPTEYSPLQDMRPTQADLSPVGVGVAGGASLHVDHLKIFRDLYYISVGGYDGGYGMRRSTDPLTDFIDYEYAKNVLRNPLMWDENQRMPPAEFPLEDNQFLALGDNSAKSKDSRLWPLEQNEYFVDRRLLIGKALYVYWPHSRDKLPGTQIPFPYFPNFAKMRLVR
ncbi:MAG TPA: signal peptidase I [Thermoguttaceae bacterium]|nr:signal peptidase I [Thermoguttaceae bacterium]